MVSNIKTAPTKLKHLTCTNGQLYWPMPHKQATPAKWSCPTGPSLHLNEWSPKFEDRLQAQLEAQCWQWAQRTQGVHEEMVLGSQWLIFKIWYYFGHWTPYVCHWTLCWFFFWEDPSRFHSNPSAGPKIFLLGNSTPPNLRIIPRIPLGSPATVMARISKSICTLHALHAPLSPS